MLTLHLQRVTHNHTNSIEDMISESKHFLFVSAPFGGIDIFIRNVFTVSRTSPGVRATLLPIEWNPNEWLARVPPFSWNWTLKASLIAWKRIRSLIRSGERFDGAVFNHLTPLLFLASFTRRTPHVLLLDTTPMVFEKHRAIYGGTTDTWLRRRTRGVRNAIARGAYLRASHLLPWSEEVQMSLVEDYGIPIEKTHVLPPGIDLSVFQRNPRSKCIERNADTGAFVLFVGGDFRRKGGDLLLDVARRPEFRRHEFHFVTKSFEGDPPANVVVHEAISANSPELLELYRRADVFAMPTRADLFPTISICEAMAMELPIVTTRVGGLEKAVLDGENGYVIFPNDVSALAERLLALCESPDLRVKMGQRGRRLAEQRFDIRAVSGTILKLLESTC